MLLPNVTLRRLNEFAEETGIRRRHDALSAVFAITQAAIRDTESAPEQRLSYQSRDGKSRVCVESLMACHMSLAQDLHNQRTAWMPANVDTHALNGVIGYLQDKGLYTSTSRKSEAATAAITFALSMFRTYGSEKDGKLTIPAEYPPSQPNARARHIYLRPTV